MSATNYINAKCRTCLSENNQLWSIFEDSFAVDDGDVQKSLSQILGECTKYQVQQFDGFPQSICLRCIEAAQKAFLFKRQVELSYEALLGELSAPLIKKESLDDLPDYELELNANKARLKTSVASTAVIGEHEEDSEIDIKLDISSSELMQPSILCTRKVENVHSSHNNLQHISKRSRLHQLRAKRFRCHYCAKRFTCCHIRQMHMRIHNEASKVLQQQKLLATQNLRRSTDDFELTSDKYLSETSAKQKPYQCEFCSMVLKSKTHFEIHHRRHTGEKPFKCEFCMKRFFAVGELNRHVKTHTNDRRYNCSLCSKRFIQKSALMIHERTHTGEKPFVCDQCPMGFNSVTLLNKHKLMHSEDEPFQCVKCSKGFSLASLLAKHKRTVCMPTAESVSESANISEEKPKQFNCQFCAMKFKQKTFFELHLRRHAGENSLQSCSSFCLNEKIIHCK